MVGGARMGRTWWYRVLDCPVMNGKDSLCALLQLLPLLGRGSATTRNRQQPGASTVMLPGEPKPGGEGGRARDMGQPIGDCRSPDPQQ